MDGNRCGEPGQERQRQEHGGDDGQLLHHVVEPVGHHRHVRVERAGQQVAVAVDHVADPDQVREHRVHQRVEQPVQRDQAPVGVQPAQSRATA
jgi:hypothetical protein